MKLGAYPRTVLILCGTWLLAGCAPEQSPPSNTAASEARAATQVAPVPCFEDAGAPVLRIDGVPVPAAAIEKFATLLARKHTGMSREALRMRAIEDIIVPLTALYAHHAARISGMSERARRAADRLARGDAFEAVAADMGDDLSARQGGLYGTVSRSKDSTGNLPEPMELAVFAAARGQVIGPFASKVGFQLVKVDKIVQSADGMVEQRDVRQILIHYDAGLAAELRKVDVKRADLKELVDGWQAQFTNESRAVIDAAKVEVLDPTWISSVYPFRRKS